MDGLAPADAELLAALRAGDQAAFAGLIDALSPGMMRMARLYVATDTAAEEVVQEAWIGVLKGLEGFEGRSSLKTWIFRIVINLAKTRGVRDARSVPFSSLSEAPDEPVGPTAWPEHAAETAESITLIRATVAALAPTQRGVVTLRDIVGCTAEETCSALGLSETNQRVLLHRARAKVRAALEEER